MKKQQERDPVDDLFARKLSNVSISPSPDGFERLQARMGQAAPEVRVVFWRNPVVQRYAVMAACLLFVCLFGWLYIRSESESVTKETQIVSTSPAQQPSVGQTKDEITGAVSGKKLDDFPDSDRTGANQMAASNTSDKSDLDTRLPGLPVSVKKLAERPPITTNEQPVLAQNLPPDDSKNKVDQPAKTDETTRFVADIPAIVAKLVPTERVLTVTIDEPASLAAARQLAKAVTEEKRVVIVDADEKKQQEGKSGNLWQQVKRIKQGDLFARETRTTNDERGLLGRAYNGLKQSFDKGKSDTQ